MMMPVVLAIAAAVALPAAATPDPLQAELLAISDRFMAGWQQRDFAKVATTITPDFIFAFEEGAQSRDAMMAGIKGCQLAHYAFSDVRLVRLSPTSAALVYRINQDITCAGQRVPPDTINTDTFVRADGKWLIRLTTQTIFVQR